MNMQKIAVFGANGQIGSALVELLGNKAVPLTRKDADLSRPETLATILEAIQPQAVINAAAYTQVDKAEEEREAARLANAESPAVMAAWCARYHVPFVHYSTDYVFEGSGTQAWQENAPKHPLNVYGATKLAGEVAVEAAGGKHLIFRTSWVYDATGKNFMNTMLRLGAERETLRVVADQFGAPSYAPDLARATVACLEKAAAMQAFPSGVYHLVHSGETSWHGFASTIFEKARSAGVELTVRNVEPIPASAYPTPAQRPQNSRLDCSRLKTVFSEILPEWQQGLSQALEKKYASHHLPA